MFGLTADSYCPEAKKYFALNYPCVIVPVLLVMISYSDPAVSRALTFFISKLSLRNWSTLKTIAIEIASGSPSGTPTITSAIAI